MLNSVALNLVISLVFIYLLYSLLATTINEALASVFNLRSKMLQYAIKHMFEDKNMHHDNIWTLILHYIKRIASFIKFYARAFTFQKRNKPKSEMCLTELFYEHPRIKYLGENKINNKPSYISAGAFSQTLMDILSERGAGSGANQLEQILAGLTILDNDNESKQHILTMYNQAKGSEEDFKKSIELWFNETMSRVSGWYKKQSQRMAFFIGLSLAFIFNVDSVAIVKSLSVNKDAAKNLADLAVTYVETNKDSTGHLSTKQAETAQQLFNEAKEQVNQDVLSANNILGMGWNIPSNIKTDKLSTHGFNKNALDYGCETCLKKLEDGKLLGLSVYTNSSTGNVTTVGKVRYVICMIFSSVRRMLGFLVTALAISFGAPFWFDLLGKLIKVRTAGKTTEVS